MPVRQVTTVDLCLYRSRLPSSCLVDVEKRRLGDAPEVGESTLRYLYPFFKPRRRKAKLISTEVYLKGYGEVSWTKESPSYIEGLP